MRLKNAVLSFGLLFAVIGCGDHSGNTTNRAPSVDTLVTSADWKIVLEGRSFPRTSLVMVNDEVVANECADKQSYFIDHETSTLAMPNYKVPGALSAKIEVTDMGDCSGTNESTFVSPTEVQFEMTKNGAHAEIIVRL